MRYVKLGFNKPFFLKKRQGACTYGEHLYTNACKQLSTPIEALPAFFKKKVPTIQVKINYLE